MIPPPDGDRSRGYKVLIINALLGALAFVFVVLRLYTRAVLVKRLGLDDLFIGFGFVSTLSGCPNRHNSDVFSLHRLLRQLISCSMLFSSTTALAGTFSTFLSLQKSSRYMSFRAFCLNSKALFLFASTFGTFSADTSSITSLRALNALNEHDLCFKRCGNEEG